MIGAFPYGVVGVFVPTWYYIKLLEFFKLAFVVRITSTIGKDGTGSTKNMCVLWLVGPVGRLGLVWTRPSMPSARQIAVRPQAS